MRTSRIIKNIWRYIELNLYKKPEKSSRMQVNIRFKPEYDQSKIFIWKINEGLAFRLFITI